MKSIIELNNVYFKINHPPRMILSDINLQINENDFIVILGSNGSGKSSLMKLIDKRYEASSGKIRINDQAIESYNNQTFSKLLVTLTQNALSSLFASLTVYENCRIVSKEHNKQYFAPYLADFNVNLANDMDSLVNSLSGGEQQALALALACLCKPKVLLLDEHTSALDPHAAERLMKITYSMVKKHKMTCLLTTHNLEIAKQYGTRLVAVKQGKLIQDYNENQKLRLEIADFKRYCYA